MEVNQKLILRKKEIRLLDIWKQAKNRKCALSSFFGKENMGIEIQQLNLKTLLVIFFYTTMPYTFIAWAPFLDKLIFPLFYSW